MNLLFLLCFLLHAVLLCLRGGNDGKTVLENAERGLCLYAVYVDLKGIYRNDRQQKFGDGGITPQNLLTIEEVSAGGKITAFVAVDHTDHLIALVRPILQNFVDRFIVRYVGILLGNAGLVKIKP